MKPLGFLAMCLAGTGVLGQAQNQDSDLDDLTRRRIPFNEAQLDRWLKRGECEEVAVTKEDTFITANGRVVGNLSYPEESSPDGYRLYEMFQPGSMWLELFMPGYVSDQMGYTHVRTKDALKADVAPEYNPTIEAETPSGDEGTLGVFKRDWLGLGKRGNVLEERYKFSRPGGFYLCKRQAVEPDANFDTFEEAAQRLGLDDILHTMDKDQYGPEEKSDTKQAAAQISQQMDKETKAKKAKLASLRAMYHNLGAYDRVRSWFDGTPLNRSEYYARNWMWIRCRTWHGNKFDVGGAWMGINGEAWRKSINKHCKLTAWSFKYFNIEGWGDAEVNFHMRDSECHQWHPVQAALDLQKEHAAAWKRELYLFDCKTHNNHRNYRQEQLPPPAWFVQRKTVIVDDDKISHEGGVKDKFIIPKPYSGKRNVQGCYINGIGGFRGHYSS
ncbi:hypothetical protein S40285_05037 [Stachybotrys chlorohalonatus IBT 40285]|uniref:Enterotoxin n=1 Tax=Stachybotrys chlorohalonatus (strain IBT 40285) TaxID=1283841 RepID=A0A084QFM7_STAC4|nr:hypothetical protein S40285_05037 [Stachybotrys chlorohalonata IBT 40285]